MAGQLKQIGGSQSDGFNDVLANAVKDALWAPTDIPEERQKLITAGITAMVGIAPRVALAARQNHDAGLAAPSSGSDGLTVVLRASVAAFIEAPVGGATLALKASW